MQWFRLHHKILNDRVVQGLSDSQFKIYINVLCHASSIDRNGQLGSIDEIAFALRETNENVSSCFIAFHDLGLVVSSGTVDETFHIPQWKKLQYKSDTSTGRVKKYRETQKRSKTVTETPPDTDTDTEQIQNNNRGKATRFTPPSSQEAFGYFTERGSLDASNEAEKFVDFYTSKDWMVGKNKMKDWRAAVRNWMRKRDHSQNTGNTANYQQTPAMFNLTDTSWAEGLVCGSERDITPSEQTFLINNDNGENQ